MNAIISDIKKELRASMNGVASKAMRDAGMTADYRVNFGVELPRLRELATDVVRDMLTPGTGLEESQARLAQQLWKESVRECRILATMLYPPQRMDIELADIWCDGIQTLELAQIAALHLFSRVPLASSLAFRWIAGEDEMKQTVGFYTICHLVRTGELSARSADELLDQTEAALQSDNYQLRLVAGKVKSALAALV